MKKAENGNLYHSVELPASQRHISIPLRVPILHLGADVGAS